MRLHVIDGATKTGCSGFVSGNKMTPGKLLSVISTAPEGGK
jgi:hypothetical protein